MPFKKSSKNGMVYLEHEGKRVLFSPFFECEHDIDVHNLRVKILVKMGNDGVKDLKAIDTANNIDTKRHLLVREISVFIFNNHSVPVSVVPKFLEIIDDTIVPLETQAYTIEPKQYYESKAIVHRDIRTRKSIACKLILEYDNSMHELACQANRLSIDELKAKYPTQEEE
jgi:hypothetical protein